MGLALQQAEVSLGRPIADVGRRFRQYAAPAGARAGPEAPPPPPPPKKTQARVALFAGLGVLAVVAVGAAVLLLGGGDDDDGGGGGGGIEVDEDAADVAFRPIVDDSGAIALQAPDFWSDVNGRALEFDDGTQTPDVVIAEDAGSFLDDPEVSGVEVTAFDLTDAPEVVAGDLLSGRSDARGLGPRCTSDLPPARTATFGGVPGLLQRFEGCDGTVIVLFAGVQGTVGVLVETHLVDAQDELVLDQVLESVQVDLSDPG